MPIEEQGARYWAAVWNSFEPTDVLDIGVVSVFVYALLTWFGGARSRLIMSGIAMLVVLYFAAVLLEMQLTLALLRGGVTIAVVALVVIFQEEIRRGFERVALATRLGPRRYTTNSDKNLDALVESVALLAEAKVGALLVFKGKEPLERHLTDGVVLNGQLSPPLLFSIFDPTSPGHDGALIVAQDGRVTRFGVHLPLSTQITGGEQHGTRHAAALGLSERSDALVVAVSEERGTISIAEGEKLETLDSPAVLRARLRQFQQRFARNNSEGLVTSFFTHRLALKLLSVLITLVAWVVVFGYQSESATRTVVAPIEMRQIPEGWMLEGVQPLEAVVQLAGPERALDSMAEEKLVVAINVGEPSPGFHRRVITMDNFDVPKEVVVQSIEPRVVRYTAHRTTTVELPVKLTLQGSVPAGYEVTNVSVNPSTVAVVLPQALNGRIAALTTAPISLDNLKAATSLDLALVLPPQVSLAEDSPQQVTVVLQVEPAIPPISPTAASNN